MDIFRIQAVRNILELLLYYNEYPKIDKNLSDCNGGCCKNRNMQDNTSYIKRNGSKLQIDISVYDIEKCFDSLWIQDCINGIYLLMAPIKRGEVFRGSHS